MGGTEYVQRFPVIFILSFLFLFFWRIFRFHFIFPTSKRILYLFIYVSIYFVISAVSERILISLTMVIVYTRHLRQIHMLRKILLLLFKFSLIFKFFDFFLSQLVTNVQKSTTGIQPQPNVTQPPTAKREEHKRIKKDKKKIFFSFFSFCGN